MKDYLSRYPTVQSRRKRVKKKNVGITGTIVFIERAHPDGETHAPFTGLEAGPETFRNADRKAEWEIHDV